MKKKNPIELEVDKVEAQWEEFVQMDQPILRWLISSESNQLVSTFIKLQEECDEKVSDLFIPLYAPFDNMTNYGFDLVDEINQLIKSEVESLPDEENLTLPKGMTYDIESDHSLQAFLSAAEKIIDLLGESFEYLVFVLRPSRLSTAKHWREWCGALAQLSADKTLWSNNLRIILMDDKKYPVLDKVAEDQSLQIHSMVPAVDVKKAIEQVFDDADDGSPGAKYRKNYVAMQHAVENNNLESVELHSKSALAIAGEHQWFDLWVAILLLRAGAYQANGRTDDAVYDYQTAQRFAKMGFEKSLEGCGKSWIFALLSEAGVWLSLKKWSQAAELYKESAERSEALKESFFHMDSWRMVCFCQEQQKLQSDAWQSGLKALEAAEALTAEEKEASTLAYIGEALIRLSPTRNEEYGINQKMEEFLGEEWLNMIAQAEEAEAC